MLTLEQAEKLKSEAEKVNIQVEILEESDRVGVSVAPWHLQRFLLITERLNIEFTKAIPSQ